MNAGRGRGAWSPQRRRGGNGGRGSDAAPSRALGAARSAGARGGAEDEARRGRGVATAGARGRGSAPGAVVLGGVVARGDVLGKGAEPRAPGDRGEDAELLLVVEVVSTRLDAARAASRLASVASRWGGGVVELRCGEGAESAGAASASGQRRRGRRARARRRRGGRRRR